MTTVWERRDLPVLRALATSEDETLQQGYLVLGGDDRTPLELDLEHDEIVDSILTLNDAGYVEGELLPSTGGAATFTHFHVTGHGLQALGEWPLFAETVSPLTMAALLERLAEEAPTEEESANARAAAYVRSVGAVALRAAATATTSQLVRVALGLP